MLPYVKQGVPHGPVQKLVHSVPTLIVSTVSFFVSMKMASRRGKTLIPRRRPPELASLSG